MKRIPAGKFKATCLALLDRIARTGERVVVTKRGKPVAEVGPVRARRATSLRRSVRVIGDLLPPVDEQWDADR